MIRILQLILISFGIATALFFTFIVTIAEYDFLAFFPHHYLVYFAMLAASMGVGVIALYRNNRFLRLLFSNAILYGLYALLFVTNIVFFSLCTSAIIILTLLQYYMPPQQQKPYSTILFAYIAAAAYFVVVPYMFSDSIPYKHILQAALSYSVWVLPLCFLRRYYKHYIIGMILVLSICSLPQLFHILLYNDSMHPSSYYSMFESNAAESKEYISMYMSWKFVGLILLFMLAPVSYIYMLPRNYLYNPRLGIFAAIIIGGITLHSSNYLKNPIGEFAYYKHQHAKELALYIQQRNDRMNGEQVFKEATCMHDSLLSVIIIGESTGRNHMGLYGYGRQTNPLLSTMQDDLLVFTDVLSPNSHTIESVSKILTFGNNEDIQALYTKGNMIDIFNSAGFETILISNQTPAENGILNKLFESASTAIYISDYIEHNTPRYDELIFTYLRRSLRRASERTCIIIHLLGTHGNYADRYPKRFERWSGADSTGLDMPAKTFLQNSSYGRWQTNMYDNAVGYNDSIIYTIIQEIHAMPQPAYMLYFSDHGEDVYDNQNTFSHQEANATTYMFEIPFMVWFSDSYKKQNPQVETYKTYIDRPYQTDDVIHSIVDISRISVHDYEPERSIFNPKFKERTRYIAKKNYVEFLPTAPTTK